ncbi:hypothetical protein K490DRAFT_16992, partial [Saccharata proteae CBS 121410]
PFDTSHRFCTSWLLPPGLLFGIRALLALYAFFETFFNLGWTGTHYGQAGQSFSYFTNLTYWGISFYMLFSALHTGTYWMTGRPLLDRWPRVLQEMHSILYSTICVFPFIVTIVFWALLYSGFADEYYAWYNISVHAMNSVFALFEILIPRTNPLPWIHILPLIILLALYLAVAEITYGTQHYYVYSFLNTSTNGKGVVTGYCFGILIAMIIILAIVHGIQALRKWVTERKLGMTGKFSKRDR